MPHDINLISTIAVGLAFAFVFGWIANALRLPPLVGYLVAGIMVGPYSPGFDADTAMASQLGGTVRFLPKPWSAERLLDCVQSALVQGPPMH